MSTKKKSQKKRHDAIVELKYNASAAETAEQCCISCSGTGCSTGCKSTEAKTKRSRFVITSVVEKPPNEKESLDESIQTTSVDKPVVPAGAAAQCANDDSGKSSSGSYEDDNDASGCCGNSNKEQREIRKSSSFDDARCELLHTREMELPNSQLTDSDDRQSRTYRGTYLVQPIIYCTQQIPVIQVSQLVNTESLLKGRSRRPVTQYIFSANLLKSRLNQPRDRSVPNIRNNDSQRSQAGFAAVKESLRRWCLTRRSASAATSPDEYHSVEQIAPVSTGLSKSASYDESSIVDAGSNVGAASTLADGKQTKAAKDQSFMVPQQMTLETKIIQPETVSINSNKTSLVDSGSATSQQQRSGEVIQQKQSKNNASQSSQQRQQLVQKQAAAALSENRMLLNRRRQSDLGSLAMMHRKFKVNGANAEVINFDDLRERLEQLTGTTCASVSNGGGVGLVANNGGSKLKKALTIDGKSLNNNNKTSKASDSVVDSGISPATKNQRHNSIAVVGGRNFDRSPEARQPTSTHSNAQFIPISTSVASVKKPSEASQDLPYQKQLHQTPASSSSLQHSQSTIALSSLVSSSTQTCVESAIPTLQSATRRHSDFHVARELNFKKIGSDSFQTFHTPEDVEQPVGTRLNDSLSLDDVVAMINSGESLYDVGTEDSFWQELSRGFAEGQYLVASREEALEETLFDCAYDEALDDDEVAMVMVDAPDTTSASDNHQFRETLARQKLERDITKKRQARERFELHRWYVRHGKPSPRLTLESIYFSSFFRKSEAPSITTTPGNSTATDKSTISEILTDTTKAANDDTSKNKHSSTDTATIATSTAEKLLTGTVDGSAVITNSKNRLQKQQQSQSLSVDDDDYNSIDKHFNGSSNDEADGGTKSQTKPKSPWELAYSKKAEQLAFLQQLSQQQEYSQKQQQEQLLHRHAAKQENRVQQFSLKHQQKVFSTISPNLVQQLQLLLSKKQQIMALTQLFHDQQLQWQQLQQQQLHQKFQLDAYFQLAQMWKNQLQQQQFLQQRYSPYIQPLTSQVDFTGRNVTNVNSHLQQFQNSNSFCETTPQQQQNQSMGSTLWQGSGTDVHQQIQHQELLSILQKLIRQSTQQPFLHQQQLQQQCTSGISGPSQNFSHEHQTLQRLQQLASLRGVNHLSASSCSPLNPGQRCTSPFQPILGQVESALLQKNQAKTQGINSRGGSPSSSNQIDRNSFLQLGPAELQHYFQNQQLQQQCNSKPLGDLLLNLYSTQEQQEHRQPLQLLLNNQQQKISAEDFAGCHLTGLIAPAEESPRFSSQNEVIEGAKSADLPKYSSLPYDCNIMTEDDFCALLNRLSSFKL